MDLEIAGRHAFVGGSTEGLGLAIAQALAAEGARVTITGRREEVARAEADRLTDAIGVGMDILDPASQQSALAKATDRHGPVDIAVLNGGGPPPGDAAGIETADLETAVQLLLISHQRLVAQVLPGMRERQWGRILAVGSRAIQEPIAGLALSNIVRVALAGYLKTLSREVAADGVTVNMVLPGRIRTRRVDRLDQASAERNGISPEEARSRSEETIPAGRYGTPTEFGEVAAFLCSERARYITGSQIRVDGGQAAGF